MKSKILIVEDISIEAMNFEHWLKSFGYDVVGIANNAEDAIKKITFLKPDLILMDIILKGEIDGIDIANKIKESNIPVIYLTAHPEESTVTRAILTSPYGYLTKPINKIELKNTIELAIYKNKIERQLKKSEERYRNIVENVQDAYFRADKEGKIIMVSPSAVQMFKFDSKKDMVGIPAVSLYKKTEDRTYVLKKLKEDSKVNDFQFMGLRKDGSSFWVSMNVQFNYDEHGQIVGTEGFIRDITERIKSKRILKENERFRALLDKSSDLIRILDKDGRIIFDSPSSQRILGYPEGFFIGKNPLDFIHSDDKLRVKNALNGLYQNRTPVSPIEFRILKSDGTYILVESVAQNLTDVPGIEGIVATTHPLTESKMIEKALRKSERLLADIIDFLPDATFAIDHEGKVIAWNRAVEKMTGTNSEDIIGKGNFECAIPWYGKRRPILIDLIRNENLNYRSKYDFIREDGETLKAEVFVPSVYGDKGAYLWVTASPLLDSNGQQYGAIESVRDITERKQAEFALKRSEERFRAVAESAVDLIITTDVNGTVLFCNRSLEIIFGYSREEIIGQNLTVLMPERLKKDYINGLEVFKSSGEHIRVGKTLKTIGLRKDGTEFPFEMSLASWKSGEKNFFTSIIRDITESEKAKTQIMESLNEKEILLKEFTIGLKIIYR